MGALYPLPENQPEEVHENNTAEREAFIKKVPTSTGFVVGETEDHLDVLTCAHPLSHVFDSENPIAPQRIGDLYQTAILCDHCESKFRSRTHKTRKSVPAVVHKINCKKDLLLVRVPNGILRKSCRAAHPPLLLASRFPGPLERTVMLSWPPFRPRTACVGETSCEGRRYSDVSLGNPNSYTMDLSEVSILADKGSSGAPLLNGDRDVVGALHGGEKSSLCYFISLDDIRICLTEWGVIK
ncbi:hypothetical protein QOZ80_5BG0453170 [Eleusine coracana subsp. coracana]|nr:hypothetical protein QOZ80_5BG0453170 [Eleusine coracana subsp. coracana]